jgi:hypothetical protein
VKVGATGVVAAASFFVGSVAIYIAWWGAQGRFFLMLSLYTLIVQKAKTKNALKDVFCEL